MNLNDIPILRKNFKIVFVFVFFLPIACYVNPPLGVDDFHIPAVLFIPWQHPISWTAFVSGV